MAEENARASALHGELSSADSSAGYFASYPIVVGGGLNVGELAELNAAVKAYAQSMLHDDPDAIDIECVPGHCSYSVSCTVSLVTREVSALACDAALRTTSDFEGPRITSPRHTTFYFSPRTGRPIDVRALAGGDTKALADRLGDLDSAVLTPTGFVVAQSGALVSWSDLADTFSANSFLRQLAKNPPPAPTGEAAWSAE